jgi:hypothetical protein
MSQLDPLRTFTELTIGKRVDRDAAVITGGGADVPIFNILGGRVAIRQIIGEITVGASGATNMTLQSTPTIGTAAAMCLLLSVNAQEVGTLLTITGAVGDAMYGVSAGLAQSMTRDLILPIGAIEVTSSAAETVTIKWSVFYVPIDDGAYIEAV